MIHCAQCGSLAPEGPYGGYVCPLCYNTVTPQEMPPLKQNRDRKPQRDARAD